ncbi:sensor domain-containing diguanylate cyclase [Petrocella sp. FN5]|uniref:sensor domain-containing diguanylate cyclase n=1 Tax=Petrocella sp. FN5 TaxID=3032002 RepID=UPI0023DA345A|nr:sensor domain-containing diguanylate cyclase [Petrocella sp. FN5]MDF1617148.1 sensor domain-containing diguanylate cyclase [Petrocella sp. FN5]
MSFGHLKNNFFKQNKRQPLSLPEGLVIRTILNNSEDTIYFKNLDSKFILNSKAHALQQNEHDPSDMVGKDDFDYFPYDFAKAAYDDEQRIIQTGKSMIGHVEKWVQEDGSVTWFLASKYPLLDDQNKIIGTWGTSKDITDLKVAQEQLTLLNKQLQEANQRLEFLSMRDGLSGLFNHRHFYESLNMALAQVSRQKKAHPKNIFTILLLDIDHFKVINDTYGHLVGDIVIRTIGETLKKSTRITDTCFRYGGDEFAIILSDTELNSGQHVAETLRKMLASTPIVTEGLSFHIKVSFGVVSSDEASSATELVELADKRLYQSKTEGRNRVN